MDVLVKLEIGVWTEMKLEVRWRWGWKGGWGQTNGDRMDGLSV